MAERTPPTELQTRRASFKPGSSVNEERRTVDLVWTTGAKVFRQSWEGPFYEELSLDPKHVDLRRLNSGAPFLANHDGSSVADTLGVVERAWLEGDKGIATIRFAAKGISPEADRVFELIRDGIVANVSVGYRVHKMDLVDNEKIPTYRATSWEPHELSAVSIGADAGAHFRSENQPRSTTGVSQMKVESKDVSEQLLAENRERVAGITAAVRTARLGDDVAKRLIDSGVSLSKARETVLSMLADQSDAIKTETHAPTAGSYGRFQVGEEQSDKYFRAATSALILRSGAKGVEQSLRRKMPGFEDLDLNGGGELRGWSLLDFCRESLELKGVKTRGLDARRLVGLAFTHRSSGMASTSDFPVLLENALNKVLLGAYQNEPDTWSRFCAIEEVSDFRDHPRYRLGSIDDLDEVTESGEFKRKPLPDGSKLSINVETKGNIIAITRRAIVNDDMGAMANLAAMLGRAAKRSIENDVYALLALNSGLGPDQDDASPFFDDTARGNVSTSSTLSAANLDLDRVKMAAQRDPSSNEYLNLTPAILLVPTALEGQAKVIVNSDYNHDASKLNQPNLIKGLFRDVVGSPRLTGNRRYVFAAPEVCPAIVVTFLNGQREPLIESQQEWTVDGSSLRVRLDVKAQMFDSKGAITNAGG